MGALFQSKESRLQQTNLINSPYAILRVLGYVALSDSDTCTWRKCRWGS